MRASSVLLLAIFAGSGCSDALPPQGAVGSWVSDSASLTVTDTSAELVLLTSIGCYGSFDHTAQSLGADQFAVSGTYTQLTGAYPGQVEYASQLAGESQGSSVTLTLTVPSIALTLGPLHLIRGQAPSWPRCFYP